MMDGARSFMQAVALIWPEECPPTMWRGGTARLGLRSGTGLVEPTSSLTSLPLLYSTTEPGPSSTQREPFHTRVRHSFDGSQSGTGSNGRKSAEASAVRPYIHCVCTTMAFKTRCM